MPRLGLISLVCVVVTLSVGCASAADRTADPGAGAVPCTEIGCTSGLQLALGPVTSKLDNAATIKVCLQRKCRLYTRRKARLGAYFSIPGLTAGQLASVRLVVSDGDGHVILRRSVRAPVRKVRPNGPECPPTCFQVAVQIDRQSLNLVAPD